MLDAGNTITSQDHGLLEATSSGEIDVKDGTIDNIGANPLAAIDPSGILLSSGGTLLVDVAQLTLDGSGAVALQGGIITGQAANAADILVNLNNVISGSGLISNLTLTNGATIDATVGLLTIDSSTVTNTGLLEADGGTLVLSNTSVDNSDHHSGDPVGTITVTALGVLDLESATISDGTLNNAGTLETKSGTSTISDIADSSHIQNNNILIVDSGTTLNLTDDYFSGGTITVDSGGILNLTDTTITSADLNNEGGAINIFGTTTIDTIQSILVGQTTVESGQILDLNNELVLGSITVEGASAVPAVAAGVLNIQSNDTIENGALDNAGQINVTGTVNEIETTTSFTNSGNIEVKAGATLTLSGDSLDNSSGTITVDTGASGPPPLAPGLLTVINTSITDGTLDNNGTLDLTGGDTVQNGAFTNTATVTVSGTGNAIDSETSFSNTGTLEVAGTLTLNNDLVTNSTGIITVDSTGTLDLTGSDTINNGQLNNNGGLIKVTGTGTEIENETGGTAFTSGTNSFSNTGTLEVAGTLTLNSDLVTNTSGIITVDSTGTLDVTGSDTINNGQLNNNGGLIKVTGTGNEIENESGGTAFTSGTNSFSNTGTLEVAGTLTLTSDLVTNTAGIITVDSNGTLDLTGSDTINNGQLNNNGGLIKVTGTGNEIENETGGTAFTSGTNSFSNTGTLEVAGTLTLNSDLVTNTSGIITVDSTGTLDLTGSDTINNGQLNNNGGLIKVTSTGNEIENESGSTAFTSGTNSYSNTGTLEVAGTLTLNSDLVTNTSGIITVDSTGTLDLTGSDTINNGQLNNNGGLIKVTGTGNEIENESGGTAYTSGTNSFTNTGTLEVAGTLTLNSDLVTNTSGIITVDSTGTLDLTGSDTINNGQLNNNGGLIKVTGTGNEIENETGGTARFTSGTNSFTNTGTVTIGGTAAGTLTLNSDLVTNTAGIITVDSNGTLDLTGSDTINNGQLNNNGGLIKVTGTGNEIENESGGTAFTSGTNSFTNTGTVTIGGTAAGTLTLNSDLVTNTAGIITVDSTGTLDLTGSDAINNGQLNNNGGLIKVTGTGNEIENESGGTAFTSGTNSFTNTGTTEVSGTLTLNSDLVTNTSGIITVDSTGTLDLTGSDTINNGQLNNNGGLIKVTGTGNEIENESGASTVGAGTNSFTNTGTLEVAGTLTLNSDLVTNTSGIITVDSTGTPRCRRPAVGHHPITVSSPTTAA